MLTATGTSIPTVEQKQGNIQEALFRKKHHGYADCKKIVGFMLVKTKEQTLIKENQKRYRGYCFSFTYRRCQ